MDAYEFISTLRDQSGLMDQSSIGTPLLLRILNLALKDIQTRLYKVFDQFLVKEVILAAQSGTQVTAPKDVLNVINVWREKNAATDDYEMCARVPLAQRGMLGTIHWPIDDDVNPLYINEGRNIRIYPELDTLDVKIQYRKRVVDIGYGRGLTGILGSEDKITLDKWQSPEEDAFNDYFISIYEKDADGTMSFYGVYKIIDYTGVTGAGTPRVATLDSDCEVGVGTLVWFAIHPLLPSEFDHLVLDAAMIYLGKNQRLIKEGLVNFNIDPIVANLERNIAQILDVNNLQEEQINNPALEK